MTTQPSASTGEATVAARTTKTSVRDAVVGTLRRVEAAAQHRLPPRVTESVALGARRLAGLLHLGPRVPGPATGGAEVECPICGHRASAFMPFGVKVVRPDCRCPRCGSLERHRALWLLLRDRTDLFRRPHRVLHVAPEPFFAGRLSRMPGIDHLSGDLDPRGGAVRLDVTAIDADDATFDVVIANHVLEHVPDDRRAMAEVHRVLRPGGWALLPVPMWGETTREDPTVTDPAERERRFGQADHVRMYGHDGELEDRLASVGFSVEVVDLATELPEEDARRYRLRGADLIPVCTKAMGA